MARTWFALNKVLEETAELAVELNKLAVFPSGKHPGRTRSVILSSEDELADVLASVQYYIDRNGLDRKRIERRVKAKYKKFVGWWGKHPQAVVPPAPPKQKRLSKKTLKKLDAPHVKPAN